MSGRETKTKDQYQCEFAVDVMVFLSQIWLRGVRAIRDFDKNEFDKVFLVGSGACACHVLLHSVYFNWILASGGNGRAIGIV